MNSYFICRLLDDFNVLKVSKTHLEESYRRLRGRALLLKTFKYNLPDVVDEELPDVVDEEFYFRQWDLIQQRAEQKNQLLCLFTLTWLLLEKSTENAKDLAIWFIECVDDL